jgi:hypothetical protein
LVRVILKPFLFNHQQKMPLDCGDKNEEGKNKGARRDSIAPILQPHGIIAG